MPENEIDLTHTETFYFKGRNGEIKELQVKIPMEPGKLHLDFEDRQLLAKAITKALLEEKVI